MSDSRDSINAADHSPLVCAVFLIGLALLPAAAAAQEFGDTVVKQGRVTEDLYLAGGTVDMLANVEGDVIAAGGQVNIDNVVSGDVMAAGGNVAIRARVGDDVRVCGGNVTISGSVGDDLVACGGQLSLAPNATVGGRAFVAGGNVQINGKVGKGVKAAGNHVVIAGDVTGDVELYAESIDIAPSAVIHGNLTYYSREKARIAGGAQISGSVKHEPLAPGREARERARGFHYIARLALSITLMITGIVLYLLFPTVSVGAAHSINESPWKSLGLGFAILAATPLVVLLLCISFFGIWLGLLALGLYLMLWLLGFLTGILYVGDWGLRLIDRAKTATKGWRVLSIVAALLALWIIRFVPILGGLVAFAILIFGLGALTLYLWRRYVSA